MQLLDVIQTIQAIADNSDLAPGINQVHALYVATAVLRSLPEDYINLLDAVLDVEPPPPQP